MSHCFDQENDLSLEFSPSNAPSPTPSDDSDTTMIDSDEEDCSGDPHESSRADNELLEPGPIPVTSSVWKAGKRAGGQGLHRIPINPNNKRNIAVMGFLIDNYHLKYDMADMIATTTIAKDYATMKTIAVDDFRRRLDIAKTRKSVEVERAEWLHHQGRTPGESESSRQNASQEPSSTSRMSAFVEEWTQSTVKDPLNDPEEAIIDYEDDAEEKYQQDGYETEEDEDDEDMPALRRYPSSSSSSAPFLVPRSPTRRERRDKHSLRDPYTAARKWKCVPHTEEEDYEGEDFLRRRRKGKGRSSESAAMPGTRFDEGP